MKRVYICCPYSGTPEEIVENKARAWRYARLAVELGYRPFVPHFHFEGFMDERSERGRIMAFCGEEVLCSDEIWQCTEHGTAGMNHELGLAMGHGIPVVRMWVVEP